MSDRTKLVVISDIHAFSSRGEGEEEPSYARAAQPPPNPFTELLALIEERTLTADFLLCPGDICDQADGQGLVYAWEKLDQVAGALGAELVATAGNHDLDSRFLKSTFNPKGALQALVPSFPHAGKHASDMYWARNFSVLRKDKTIVVSLNSAGFHGYHNEDRLLREFNHGRVSAETVAALAAEVGAVEDDDVEHRILLCHHHPQVIGPFRDLEGDSAMRDAHLLLDEVEGGTSPWLIIHGHRHFPYLSYAPGGATAPVIFSAGSFSRRLNDIYDGQVDNQCYAIELLSRSESESLSLDIAGRFLSWTWAHSEGWIPAPPRSGLPRHGGFGARPSINALRSQILEVLKRAHPATMEWSQVREAVPLVQYLIPVDLRKLFVALEAAGAILEPATEELYLGDTPAHIGVA